MPYLPPPPRTPAPLLPHAQLLRYRTPCPNTFFCHRVPTFFGYPTFYPNSSDLAHTVQERLNSRPSSFQALRFGSRERDDGWIFVVVGNARRIMPQFLKVVHSAHGTVQDLNVGVHLLQHQISSMHNIFLKTLTTNRFIDFNQGQKLHL